MSDDPYVSVPEQIACVEREIKMRERVYPRWVENGRMTQAQADRELRVMRCVLSTLQVIDATQRWELFPR